MNSCVCAIYDRVDFSVPGDSAYLESIWPDKPYCVRRLIQALENLIVEWSDTSISFANGHDVVDYKLHAVKGLYVTYGEEIEYVVPQCTLRIAIIGFENDIAHLLVLSTAETNRVAFDATIAPLFQAALPIPIASSYQELLDKLRCDPNA